MMGKSNTILDYFKRKNAQSSLKFDHRLHVTYENMMLINEVQNNSTHVVLFKVCTLSSILKLSGFVIIWIL
jgi:transposase